MKLTGRERRINNLVIDWVSAMKGAKKETAGQGNLMKGLFEEVTFNSY